MNSEFSFNIVSPDKIEYSGIVKWVMLSATTGQMEVLPDHFPVVAMLGNGPINFFDGNENISKWINGGFMEFSDNEMIILADKVE